MKQYEKYEFCKSIGCNELEYGDDGPKCFNSECKAKLFHKWIVANPRGFDGGGIIKSCENCNRWHKVTDHTILTPDNPYFICSISAPEYLCQYWDACESKRPEAPREKDCCLNCAHLAECVKYVENATTDRATFKCHSWRPIEPEVNINEMKSILDEASKTINGERQDSYGKPEDSFQIIADFWAGYLKQVNPVSLNAMDVAHMMTLFKIARMMGQKPDRDNYRDAIGYLAIAADRLSND